MIKKGIWGRQQVRFGFLAEREGFRVRRTKVCVHDKLRKLAGAVEKAGKEKKMVCSGVCKRAIERFVYPVSVFDQTLGS